MIVMENAEAEFRGEVAKLRPKRILNIACGVNLKPAFLKNIDAEFCGTDIDRRVIGKRVKFCDIDRQRVPYPDNHFDLVISIYTIEHFRTRKFFSEARRLVKKDGRLIFITTNLSNPLFFLANLLKIRKYYYRYRVGFEELYPAPYRTNTPQEISKVLEKNGFRLDKMIFYDQVKGYFSFLGPLSGIVGFFEKKLYYVFPSLQPTIYVSATKI